MLEEATLQDLLHFLALEAVEAQEQEQAQRQASARARTRTAH